MEVGEGCGVPRDHHVHFSESTDQLKNNDIIVRQRGTAQFEVQLGFIKVNHTYEIDLVMERSLLPKHSIIEEYGERESPNTIFCHLLAAEENSKEAKFKLQFKAIQDKVTKEKLVLVGGGDDIEFTVVARVLGKDKGTPMLRNGIKCVGVDTSDETDGSDWQGF